MRRRSRALAAAAALAALALPARASDPVPADAGRAWWQEHARELHASQRAAQARHEAAVAAYERMRSRGYPAGDARAAIVAERDAAAEALRAAERELEALPEQARRAGAPPGWIRESQP